MTALQGVVGRRRAGAEQSSADRFALAQRRRRRTSTVLAHSAPLLLLALWATLGSRIRDVILPPPDAVFRQTWRLIQGDLAIHTYTSFGRILVAVVLAMFVGSTVVLMAVLFPVTARLVSDRFIPFMNSIPALGWAIVGVIWFGVSNFAVVFVIFAIILPFCMVNLWEGSRNIDRGLSEMGTSFTRSRIRVILRIEAPLLIPYALAAVRLSFSVGWKVALIAEFFGARAGLGRVLQLARERFDTPTVFAVILVVVIIVSLVERAILDRLSAYFAARSGGGAVDRGEI
jgi:NitT/TauT family transport system permease protein